MTLPRLALRTALLTVATTLMLTGCTQSPAAQMAYDEAPKTAAVAPASERSASVETPQHVDAADPALREDIKTAVKEAWTQQKVKSAVADAWASR
jgi:PBP1b-binding outer membrane lipoprotein LpoB